MRLLGFSPGWGHLCSLQKSAILASSGTPCPKRQEDLRDQRSRPGSGVSEQPHPPPLQLYSGAAAPGTLIMGAGGVLQAPQRAGCLADHSFYPPVLGSKPHNSRAMLVDSRGFVNEREPLATTPEARTARARGTWDCEGSYKPVR